MRSVSGEVSEHGEDIRKGAHVGFLETNQEGVAEYSKSPTYDEFHSVSPIMRVLSCFSHV